METMAGDIQMIKADVPLSEVLTYASQLKSMTGGQGSFAMEFKAYEGVPANVQQQIVEKHARARSGEEEE